MAMYGLGSQPLSQGYGQAPQANFGSSNDLNDANNPHSWSDANNIFSPAQTFYAGGAGFGLDTGAGKTMSVIGDPMDIFGNRGAAAQAKQDDIARRAAIASLTEMGDQYNTTLDLQMPFLGLGQQGLNQIGQYTQGQNFDAQLNQGARQLRGSGNASGLGNSSASARNMSGFVSDLTQEDMDRQYMQAMNNIVIGQNAVGTMGQAAQGLGSSASNIYGNWANQAGQNAMNYGDNRSQMYNSLGQTAMGAGQYYGSK